MIERMSPRESFLGRIKISRPGFDDPAGGMGFGSNASLRTLWRGGEELSGGGGGRLGGLLGGIPGGVCVWLDIVYCW